MAGAFAHGAIFFLRDYDPEQKKDNVLARMLEHKEAIIAHVGLVYSFPFKKFHTLGLYVHNDVMLAFGTPEKQRPNSSLLMAITPSLRYEQLIRVGMDVPVRTYRVGYWIYVSNGFLLRFPSATVRKLKGQIDTVWRFQQIFLFCCFIFFFPKRGGAKRGING